MPWDGKVKPFLFDMSVPQFFIRAPCAPNGGARRLGAVLPPTFMAISMLKNARGLILPFTPMTRPSAPPPLTRRYVWYSLATEEC